ncbi:MAG: YidB family protein [Candidatus Dormibacter sp.]|uniref:YidB family protein n=1 Tax=Candidatus Dormibacter sp. TaxID=2973982 RepID=UPI000DB7D1B4|nr:MAG: hypothetical protein DLM66_10925 [Candidatus Dormibacteraeota bacterium]
MQRGGSGGQGPVVGVGGENQPLHPDDIERMLGGEKIEAVAQQAGQSPEAVKAGLAQALPHVVNALTPEGTIPDDTQLAALGDRVAQRADPGPIAKP